MRALLDVNVQIALLDEAHIEHVTAMRWLAGALDLGWASRPINHDGCIRIMSQPACPGALPTGEVAATLAEARQHHTHHFWTDGLCQLDPGVIDWTGVLGYRQVAGDYRLALAVHNQGRSVTFDGRTDLSALPDQDAKHRLVLQTRPRQ